MTPDVVADLKSAFVIRPARNLVGPHVSQLSLAIPGLDCRQDLHSWLRAGQDWGRGYSRRPIYEVREVL